MSTDVTDVTIIGGGPAGLYAAFFAGMRERSVRIIDSLPDLGGQLLALYPKKYIYDVGGFPKVLAKDLGEGLIRQALQFDPEVVLNEEIHTFTREDDILLLDGHKGRYSTRTLVLAGGKGAFEPVRLECPGAGEFLGRGIDHAVPDPEVHRGRRLLLVGGGDSALDWALSLKDLASHLLLIHRREAFRAHEATVSRLQACAEAGELEMRPCHEVKEIRGTDAVEEVIIYDNRTGEEATLEVDVILTFLGFKPDLGPLKRWGLELEGNRVVVNRRMETNLPGVYAAGDMVDYEGKMDLIAMGFSEAAVAVNAAVRYVDPNARAKPGHSTNLKIFKDT
jgi:thioredoxin reductase (NADPH)